MTRKDSEKDADRPHYYSQFWLDIAAGRREIGGPKPEDAEEANDEVEIPEPAPTRKSGRSSARATAVIEPVVEEEEFEQEEAVDEDELPNIVLDEVVEPEEEVIEEAPIDEEPEEEPEEEEFFDEEDEEEEEDWGKGRKKAKPARQAAKPVKKTKPRRTF